MIDRLGEVRMGQDGKKVYIEGPGKAWGMPWQVARQVARELFRLSQQIEELEKVDQIIQDGAILDAANSPVGLTSHPKIQEEIRKEAQHGVGRKVPKIHGVPSGAVVGTPGFHATPPKSK